MARYWSVHGLVTIQLEKISHNCLIRTSIVSVSELIAEGGVSLSDFDKA